MADPLKLVGVELGLDAPEQMPFLEADVIGQAGSKLVQLGGGGVFGERGEAVGEVGVLGEEALDVGILGTGVASEHGDQDLLLEAKVLPALGLPEGARSERQRLGGVGGGATEAQSQREGDVVLARERGKGLGALHLRS